MANTDVVPVPPPGSVNTNRTSPTETFMIAELGVPGIADPNCAKPVTGPFRSRIHTQNVGPFSVTGLDVALTSLTQIFSEVRVARPDLFNQVRQDGMLCVRYVGGTAIWSNHAFGIAIDLFFGAGGVISQGTPQTYQGILDLYFFFHKYGWFWGGGYKGARVDSMHFEMSEELQKNPTQFPQ